MIANKGEEALNAGLSSLHPDAFCAGRFCDHRNLRHCYQFFTIWPTGARGILQPAMTKPELAQRLGLEKGVPPGDAAGQCDRTVNPMVRALRAGQPARLPGLGTITPGKRWTLREERP